LNLMTMGKGTLSILDTISYLSMIVALAVGCIIILGAMFKGIRAEKAAAGSKGVSYQKVEAKS
ncbi:MAG: hypothetical protein WAU47_14625, partial [Desulfobaccales bacterium]